MQRTKCLHVCLHIDWNPYGTFKHMLCLGTTSFGGITNFKNCGDYATCESASVTVPCYGLDEQDQNCNTMMKNTLSIKVNNVIMSKMEKKSMNMFTP